MADLTSSKEPLGGIYLEGQLEAVFGRLEPIVTPELLVQRHLWGINLTSSQIDPLTNQPYKLTTAMLQDYIVGAISEAEAELGLVLMPTQIKEKKHYHRRDYQSWGYFQLGNKPISSLQSMKITFADGTEAYQFPNEWIEAANLVWGQVNLIPATFSGLLAPNYSANVPGNLLYLQFFNSNWVSALIEFVYVAGFPDGLMPRLINEYVGTIATIGVLSRLAATNSKNQSMSISMDGVSQTVSNPGGQLYVPRIQDLKEQREILRKKIRKIYRRIVVSSV